MILPLLLICLGVTASLVPVLPLLRRMRAVPGRGQFDSMVYRDQLQELDRDVARGLISDTEAVGARLEIQRRLLAADADPQHMADGWPGRSPVLASVVALLIAGGASGLYAWLGAPRIPDTPFASRTGAADQEVVGSGNTGGEGPSSEHADLPQAVARLAEKLKVDPSNADRWLLYARTSGSLGQWDQAADAYRHAISLGRGGAEIQAGYGEMLALQADGIVTPAAHDAFVATLQQDSNNAVARYYLALAAGQAGEPVRAIESLQRLLADIPEDSPMRDEIGKRVAEAAKAAGLPMPELAKGTPAPPQDADADAMEAASAMPEGEQKAMIAQMVSRLAARLGAEPNDADGWMRLGRAYAVMGEMDKAADAYDRAVGQKPDDVAIRLEAVRGLLTGLKPNDALPPRAVVLLRQVEEIAPDEPEVLWYLGVAAARDANTDDAHRYWARLLGNLPADSEDARTVKSAMDSLKGG